MPQTSQETVQNLVDRAVKLGDRQLAADIRAFAAQRQFGLVFEHNRPERMRLHGKRITQGDIVQVLPERGEREKPYNKLLWRVESISGDTASLVAHKTVSYYDNVETPRQALIRDVVAVAEYDQPIYAGLKETGRVERGGDRPYQVVINGENYHALETLAFAYAGKVDCIYIDPPYNTGARDWKYNNDYVDGSDEYRHSKWLAFMERRLKLSKQLLNPEKSVLIVTIDEKEYPRLELLLENVFSHAASIQTVTITINKNGVARDNQFKRSDEYAVFCFFGSAAPCAVDRKLYSAEFGDMQEKVSDESSSSRSQRKVRWEWLLRGGPNAARAARPNLFYPIFIDERDATIKEIGDSLPLAADWREVDVPNGLRAIWPLRTDGGEATWRISQPALRAKLARGCAKVGEYNKKNDRYSLLYLGDSQEERLKNGEIKLLGKAQDGSLILEECGVRSAVPTTVWSGPQFSAGEYGSRYIKRFVGDRHFTFPKSLYATELSLASVLANKRDALVIDFFSGSGTTAHAVMRLNHQDGGNRRCVCITNNEVSEDEAKKLIKRGLRQGDQEWESLGICEHITKPRVTAAITGKTPEGQAVKGNYKFVDEFPMADGFEENALFFDLTYEDPDAVELGVAFEQIAPLLWLRAGAKGRIIEHEALGYEIADSYAVLFDYASVGDFINEVSSIEGISCAYVITDDTARYANVKAQLPGIDVVRLYENYLQSFKIAAEDAVR